MAKNIKKQQKLISTMNDKTFSEISNTHLRVFSFHKKAVIVK